jgi:lysyl-tRNA synthetase class 2
MSADWRPTAAPGALAHRAAMLARTRDFFAERGVLEVETPVLSSAGTCDPQIESLTTEVAGAGRFYVGSSPDFSAMASAAAGTLRNSP